MNEINIEIGDLLYSKNLENLIFLVIGIDEQAYFLKYKTLALSNNSSKKQATYSTNWFKERIKSGWILQKKKVI